MKIGGFLDGNMRYVFVFLLLFYISPNIVLADDDIAAKQAYIETLRTEITKIDSEILRCRQTKSGWTAATVIGGVGTVATGTVAIIQGVKLGKQKKDNKE